MTHYVIRPLKKGFLPKLVELARAYWRFEKIPGFCPKRYQRLATKILKNPSLGSICMAMEGNRFIGYVVVVYLMSLEHGGMSAEIDELYVDGSRRSRGAGKALLKAAGKRLRQKGTVQISLRVGKSNPKAMRFYKRLGFRTQTGFVVMDRKGTRGL